VIPPTLIEVWQPMAEAHF